MSYTRLKQMLVVGLVIVGLSLCAGQASAFHRRHGGCGGCCGCGSGGAYGWGGYSYGSGYGYGVGYGYGFGYGGNAFYSAGSCCGGYGGFSPAYWGAPAAGGCCGANSGVTPNAIPMRGYEGTAPAPTGAPTPALPSRTSLQPALSESGALSIWVPNDAKVTINGFVTKTTGAMRRYICDDLRPGHTYDYEVKAEIVRDGKVVTEVQMVSLTAGERGRVAFNFNSLGAESLVAASRD